ncbi:MAG: PKD domain-containing protein, partial [Flavobacteriales bacterium]|nr:PKD domain-containing protein [Flavobacteriales bacterium]
MKRSKLILLLLLLVLTGAAQNSDSEKKFFNPLEAAQIHEHDHCGFDYMKELTVRATGDERELSEIQEERLNKILEARGIEKSLAGGNGTTDCQDYYRVPVVWYIVHNGSQGFVSEQRVLANMNVLNNHFSGTGIEFCLATEYNGSTIPAPAVTGGAVGVQQSTVNPGIMWVDHPYLAAMYQGGTSPQHPMLTGLSVLPEDRYLRIFVVPDAHNGAGWTYLPGWAPAGQDGIFMSHYTIGDVTTCVGNCTPGFEWGHVLTHEVGHYFNLLHIFEGQCAGGLASNCKTSGDQVCDTPPTNGGGGSGCTGTINSCTNDVPDLPDLLNNHMDYWEDACRTDFTQGQVFRMRMAAYTYRSLLVSDANQTYTGTQCVDQNWTCDLNPDFSHAVDTDDCTINFTDASTPGGSSFIGCYMWDFGDGSTSIEANPSHTYVNPGTYTVCLTVTGYNTSTMEYCECCICYDITVTCSNPACAADACITATMVSALTYSFDSSCSTTNGTVTYTWDFGDNTPTSNSPNPTHTYATHGYYTVSLTITNTINGVTCTDIMWYWLQVSQACSPTADFTWSVGNDCQILFSNASINGWPYMIITATWDFGDGSTMSAPWGISHTYLNPGTYNVCLTITVSDGVTTCTDTYCENITVNCSGEGCYAEPDFNSTDLGQCKFQFSDNTGIFNNTTIVGWDWTFGDGTTDNGQVVTHQFTNNGVFQVCLTVTCMDIQGNFCTYEYCELIVIDCLNTGCTPNAQFFVNADGNCCWEFFASDPNSLDPNCSQWVIVDGLGNTVWTATGDNTTFCPQYDDTYVICFEACCTDAAGNVTTALDCQSLIVDCFCTADPGFTIVDLDSCCYEFTSNTLDPALDACSSWMIIDAAGNIVVQGLGLSWTHCFTQSGTYQICHDQCCFNADGSGNSYSHCEWLDVD